MSQTPADSQIEALLKRFDQAHPGKFHLRITLAAGSSWMWAAFGVTVIGFVLPVLSQEWQVSPTQLGIIASIGMVGMLLGSVLAGNLADRYGRRATLELASAWIGIFSILSAFSWDYTSLLSLRLLTGVGLGAVLPVASTLISEYLPAKNRGRIMVLLSSFWGLGGVAAAAVGFLVVPVYGWRPALLCGGLAILSIPILRRYLPESLRFLLGKGRVQEAWSIADQIENAEGAAQEARIERRASAPAPEKPIRAVLPGVRKLPGLWSRVYRRRTLALWAIWFFLNFIFQGIFIWLPSLLVAGGDPLNRSYLFALIINIGQIPGAIIAAFLVDRAGRRNAFSLFLVIYSISTFLFGFSDQPAAFLLWGFVLSVCNGATWGMGYPFTTELYPTRMRGTATGWATGFGRVGGILAPYAVGWLIQLGASNLVLFSLMAAIPLLTTLAVISLRLETSGRVLEEIAS